jgi:hypothetical protein
MIGSTAPSVWWRPWPSRSRTQGEAFGGAKGEPEDEEMRSATGVTSAGVVVESVIYPGRLRVRRAWPDRSP